MPLSEKVRIEIFIPDLPDPIYNSLLEELADELSYAFGGCTVSHTSGKYRSDSGVILPDNVNLLFTDTPFDWGKDRKVEEMIDRVASQKLEVEATSNVPDESRLRYYRRRLRN